MKRASLPALVLLLLLTLALGVAGLYRMRVTRGDVFPAYSSLRADPLGTRALHDAVALLPGREVLRWQRPLDRLEAGAGDLVIVAGVRRGGRRDLGDEDWSSLDRAARLGADVVVAWHAEAAQAGDGARARQIRDAGWDREPPEEVEKRLREERRKRELRDAASGRRGDAGSEKSDADGDDTDDDETSADAETDAETASRFTPPAPARWASDFERRWGLRLARRELLARGEEADALRAEDAPADWPEGLPRWRSDLFFLPRPGEGWSVLYRRGVEPVVMSRARGQGRVTVLADSFPLSNEAVQRERATPLLAHLLGDARRVVFVESHLGVETETGLAVLARRYGLGGAAFTAFVLAALWIWRRATPLAPFPAEEAEIRLTLAPTAGLEALLRRAVAPAKLFSACLEAWRPQARPGDLRRVETAVPAGAGDPVAAYNQATRALSRKHLS